MEPTILYHDDQLLVVDKPSGMIVHPASHGSPAGLRQRDYPALDAWLRDKYGEIFLVHRIDRETSGVLLVARTEAAQEFLKRQFKNREVKKTYRAFVYGALPERGTIERPIGSTRGGLGPRSAKKPYGALRDATTVYRRIAQGQGASYAEIFPKTGRTHQIRVHLAAIGHPVVRDQLYAPGRPPLLGFNRLALHALAVRFVHPHKGDMHIEAPLPADFVAAERQLV